MRGVAFILALAAISACSKGSDENASDNASGAANGPSANSSSSPDAANKPSFDCARADGQAQELVCSDAELAAMDRELDRVYRLAQADTLLPIESRGEMAAMQRGWVKGRDDCWKADDLRQCVATSYAERIHRIRQGSKAARTEASASISVGPVAYRCEGLGAIVGATYVNSDPGVVFIEWGPETMAALPHVVAASGARYEGRVNGQVWTFWSKGKEATLTIPGKPDYSCTQDDIG